MRNKDKTKAISKSIETGERFPLSYIDSRQYVQHNVNLADGLGPLLQYFDQLPAGQSKVNPIRAFEDDDISFAHIEYHIEPYGHVVGFEVHRWEDGRVVEHWDNLQAVAEPAGVAARTMLDGPTEPQDHHRTEANKARAEDFVRRVLIGRSVDVLGDFLEGDRYEQHSPRWGDGADELRRMLGTSAGEDAIVYEKLHHVIGEGDFCLTINEGAVGGVHSAIYSMFRISNDRVVEHWDVVEAIPPRDDWKNDNGKF